MSRIVQWLHGQKFMSMVQSAVLERLTKVLTEKHVNIVVASPDWGVSTVLSKLAKNPSCLYIRLTREVDDIEAGNILSDSLAGIGADSLVAYGLSYAYTVANLEASLGLLGLDYVVLSGAEHHEGLAAALYTMPWRKGVQPKLVLAFNRAPRHFKLQGVDHFIGEKSLKLTLEEISQMLPDGAEPTWAVNIERATQGAYGRVKREISNTAFAFQASLETLLDRGQFEEALEEAVRRRDLETHLEGIVQRLLERGQYEVVLRALGSLDDSLQTPNVLLARLRASKLAGEVDEELLERSRMSLERRFCPELGAALADLMAPTENRALAERAYRSRPSLTSTRVYATSLMMGDVDSSLNVFSELVRRSRNASPSEQAIALMSAALPWLIKGEYNRAIEGFQKALEAFERGSGGARPIFLYIQHHLLFTKLLIGQHAGLGFLLEREIRATAQVRPDLAAGFRGTLGAYKLARGDTGAAGELWRENYRLAQVHTNTAHWPRNLAFEYVQALRLEGEEVSAKFGRGLNEKDPMSQLARGAALAASEPLSAQRSLESAERYFITTGQSDYLAAARFALARCAVTQGLSPKTHLQNIPKTFSDAAFATLAGDLGRERTLWSHWRADNAELYVRALGGQEVYLRGNKLPLTPKLFEIVFLLSMNPRGLSVSKLADALYHEVTPRNEQTLKVHISKLRKRFGIVISTSPYRLLQGATSDYQQLVREIGRGLILEATGRWATLCPDSSAPKIEVLRDELSEVLKREVLALGDPNALFHLASAFGHDLELWEATNERLSVKDGRKLHVQGRIAHLAKHYV